MAQTNKFGIEEMVDTLTDAGMVIPKTENLFKGRFDLLSFLTFAVSEFPTVREAVRDFGTFAQEFMDLLPDEGVNTYNRVRANMGNSLTPAQRRYLATLKAMALDYRFAVMVIEQAKSVWETNKAVLTVPADQLDITPIPLT